MRFIRKNGRIIPIKEKTKNFAKGASIGASVGFVASVADDIRSGVPNNYLSSSPNIKTINKFKELSKFFVKNSKYWSIIGATAGSITALSLVINKKNTVSK